MRIRCLAFSSDRLPKLIGVSAMGTRFAAYEYTTNFRHINPPRSRDAPPKGEMERRHNGTLRSSQV